jgi:hypothetical protein
VRSALRLTSGIAVAGLVWLAGAGISDAASGSTHASAAAISTTNCPTVGNFGDGTPQGADQAFAAISPTAAPAASSTQLAFTGANLPKEAAAGFVLILAGGLAVQRTRRRPVIEDGLDFGEAPLQP